MNQPSSFRPKGKITRDLTSGKRGSKHGWDARGSGRRPICPVGLMYALAAWVVTSVTTSQRPAQWAGR